MHTSHPALKSRPLVRARARVALSEMLANVFHLLFATGSRLDTYGDISRHDYFVSAEAF